ncbi:MAG: hypothetical protein AB7H93_16530 [Vicinamibacterales bacterium]
MSVTRTGRAPRLWEAAALAGVSGYRGVTSGLSVEDADRLWIASLDADPAALGRVAIGMRWQAKYGSRPLAADDLQNIRAVVRDARVALRQAEAEVLAATARRDRLRALLGGAE